MVVAHCFKNTISSYLLKYVMVIKRTVFNLFWQKIRISVFLTIGIFYALTFERERRDTFNVNT